MEDLIKKLNNLRPTKEQVKNANAYYAFGYVDAINAAIELVKNLNTPDVSQRSELLLSAICQFTKRNTQKEIQEVEKWIETDFRK